MNTFAVFKRESIAYFSSPVAYVFVVIFLLVSSLLGFQVGNPRFLDADSATLQGFFSWLPWIFMFLGPALGMRLWSDEQRQGTLELLMTMPLHPWQAILGKFLAASLVVVLAVALTFPWIITVTVLGEPDMGPIWTGYIGAIFYGVCCVAISMVFSALSRSQVVSFILALVTCFVLTIIGFPFFLDLVGGWLGEWVYVLRHLSLSDHFFEMFRGIVVLSDILYFLSIIVACNLITGMVISLKRA